MGETQCHPSRRQVASGSFTTLCFWRIDSRGSRMILLVAECFLAILGMFCCTYFLGFSLGFSNFSLVFFTILALLQVII